MNDASDGWAEAARLRAELDEFFYLLPAALVEVDLRTQRAVRLNFTAQMLLQYSEDDAVQGIDAHRLVTEEGLHVLLERYAADLVQSVGQGKPYERSTEQNLYYLTMIRKDGTTFEAEAQSSYLLEDGVPVAIRAMFRDITERKATEATLERTAALMRTTFESVAEAVLIFDLELNVLVFNAIASHMLEAVHGVVPPFGSPLPPAGEDSEVERMLRAHQVHVLRGETWRDELEIQQRDGSTALYEFLGSPVSVEDAITGMVVVARDTTERREAERKRLEMERHMQETQRLESLGLLASGIAHDFNNLLTAIIGNADLAMMDAVERQDDEMTMMLQSIRDGGQEAAQLVMQLLDYAGVHTAPRAPELLDMKQMVKDALGLIGNSLPLGSKVSMDLAPGLPPVRGNATQLRQAIINLVLNGVEAMQDGERAVHLSARYAESPELLPAGVRRVGEETAQGYVVVTITDTGIGMDADAVGRMFEPFYTTKFMGRGLGLAAVAGIVRTLGGMIIVQSEPGKGTSISLCFPPVSETA